MTKKLIVVSALCCWLVVEGFAGEATREPPGLEVRMLPSIGSVFFTDFSFHFLTWLLGWWEKGGNEKLTGEWVVFVREHLVRGRSFISVSFAKDEGDDAPRHVANLPPEKQIDASLNALLLAQRTIKALERASERDGQSKPRPKTKNLKPA